jgi:hypothetical protein
VRPRLAVVTDADPGACPSLQVNAGFFPSQRFTMGPPPRLAHTRHAQSHLLRPQHSVTRAAHLQQPPRGRQRHEPAARAALAPRVTATATATVTVTATATVTVGVAAVAPRTQRRLQRRRARPSAHWRLVGRRVRACSKHACLRVPCPSPAYSDEKVANRDIKGLARRRKWSLNDGQIQNPWA